MIKSHKGVAVLHVERVGRLKFDVVACLDDMLVMLDGKRSWSLRSDASLDVLGERDEGIFVHADKELLGEAQVNELVVGEACVLERDGQIS